MDVTLAVLAEAANSTGNGKLNLLGVFQTIFASEAPVHYPLFSIVATLRADSSEKVTQHSIGIQLTDADMRLIYEVETQPVDIPVDIMGPYAEINLIYAIQELTFPQFGHYQFQILIDGQRTPRGIDLFVQPIIQSRSE